MGVIANLTAWFGLHVLFAQVGEARLGPLRVYTPDWLSFDWRAALLAALACLLAFGARWSVVGVLGVAALGGMMLGLAI